MAKKRAAPTVPIEPAAPSVAEPALPTPPPPPEPQPEPAKIPGIERFEVVDVHRSELKNAPYNPRVMSEAARRKLKAGIQKLGFLSPPVWNRLSGYIVGGHQRISILDAIKGSKDYTLKVARVELSPTEEKEANLLLNNSQAQGDWDLEKLEKMLRPGDIKLEATGFDMADIYRMLGTTPFQDRPQAEVDMLATKVREAREKYEAIAEGNYDRDSPDFYVVVVFRDYDDRKEFLDRMGLADNRYHSGSDFIRLFERNENGGADQLTEGVGEPVGPAGV